MANRLAGGQLLEIIASQRAEGLSYERIAQHLHREFGVEATKQTVLKWSKDHEQEPAA